MGALQYKTLLLNRIVRYIALYRVISEVAWGMFSVFGLFFCSLLAGIIWYPLIQFLWGIGDYIKISSTLFKWEIKAHGSIILLSGK